jgi:ketosteroid isomerase-like protein
MRGGLFAALKLLTMRMKTASALLLVLVAGLTPALARQGEAAAQPSVALPPDVARVLTDYEAAWQKRDAEALSRLFAEDGFVLPNGGPPVRGRAAIRKHYTGHGGPLALRAFAYGADGSVGYILGGFARAKGAPDEGKFTLTLRKDAGGRWLIVSDMDSPNRREPPPRPRPRPQ